METKPPMEKEFIDSKEACSFLCIPKRTLYYLVSNNSIKYYQPRGGKLYFRKQDLINHITGEGDNNG